MKSGYKPTYDRRDYLHPTYGATQLPDFPTEYDVDAGLWNPNQNAVIAVAGLETFGPLFEGCTDFAQVDLYNDHTKTLHSPMILEGITHANQRGGIDIRESLNAARKLGWFDNYSQVRASGLIDMFDAIRIALLSEHQDRFGISAGTPFFPQWGGDGIIPRPSFNLSEASWHDWDIKGFKYIGDQPYLKCKMWDGTWKYMSRPICNEVFAIRGSVAYIPSNNPHDGTTIDFDFVYWIVSFFRNLLAPRPAVLVIDHTADAAPTVPPAPLPAPAYEWDTPDKARHSARVMCDEAGLSVKDKNIITACIQQESRFNPKAVNHKNDNGTADYGLCQFNTGKNAKGKPYWIGPGADFASIEEVLNDPEKNVRVMLREFKKGNLKLWSSFSTGAYKRWL